MKEVLIVSIGFSPNIGGIETHFDDLTNALDKRGWKTWVLTYKPITTKISAKIFEKRGKNVFIYRIPWIGGIFYKLVDKPFVEFFYLLPGLFLFLPIFLLIKGRNVKVIHSHGLVAGAVSVFWGRIFSKRVIITTHSIYSFPKRSLYRLFAKWIFENSDYALCLSRQSLQEVRSLGISERKSGAFTYWIDLNKFRIVPNAKEKLGLKSQFIVFCASRLVPEKGIRELLRAASLWNGRIELIVSSDGPLKDEVLNYQRKYKNIKYVGRLLQDELVLYYSASNLLIIPSIHEEGFGRVILESLACGTPVVGSSRGAIPEAMDSSVGELIDISPENIKKSVEYFYENPARLAALAKNARKFAEKRYSERNIETIVKSYEG